MLPADFGITIDRESAKSESMRCSFHIWFTDSNVYLNPGTQRTLVKTIRCHVPSVEHASTGMSPMHDACSTPPPADVNVSPQVRTLMRRLAS